MTTFFFLHNFQCKQGLLKLKIKKLSLKINVKKIKLEDLSFSTESVIGAASNLSRPAGSLSGLADSLM